MSTGASGLVGDLAELRMWAIAKDKAHQLVFTPPTLGSTVVTSYELRRCISSCDSTVLVRHVDMPEGLGLQVPSEGGQLVVLEFTRAGRLKRGSETVLSVCRTEEKPDGTTGCISGSAGRKVILHANTGVIEY